MHIVVLCFGTWFIVGIWKFLMERIAFVVDREMDIDEIVVKYPVCS